MTAAGEVTIVPRLGGPSCMLRMVTRRALPRAALPHTPRTSHHPSSPSPDQVTNPDRQQTAVPNPSTSLHNPSTIFATRAPLSPAPRCRKVRQKCRYMHQMTSYIREGLPRIILHPHPTPYTGSR